MLVMALACVVPQAAFAAATPPATPPAVDYAVGTAGFINACKYQVWTNGNAQGVNTYTTTPTGPQVTNLGTPAFTGLLSSSSSPSVLSYILVTNGNSTWSVPNGGSTTNVCVQWDAYFFAGQTGTYTFTTTSDDGSVLFIGNQLVVFNNFSQAVASQSASVSLNQGFHRITVIYGQGGGGYAMSATYSVNGSTPADINGALYLRLLPTPTFLPGSQATGNSPVNSTLSLTGAPAGVAITIYYTEDGTTPTTSSNFVNYPAPAFVVPVPKTINAIATAAGYDGSLVGTVTYSQLPTNPPTFSVSSGTYTGARSLSISSTTANAFIYYTTDGTTPTFQNYTFVGPSPVAYPLNGNVTINAFAASSGFSPSAVVSATYTRADVALS